MTRKGHKNMKQKKCRHSLSIHGIWSFKFINWAITHFEHVCLSVYMLHWKQTSDFLQDDLKLKDSSKLIEYTHTHEHTIIMRMRIEPLKTFCPPAHRPFELWRNICGFVVEYRRRRRRRSRKIIQIRDANVSNDKSSI